jgi:histidyl-tRNA synthetase
MNVNPVRGTRDFLPNEVVIRDYVKNEILKTYQDYGFQKISTPILEDVNRLLSSDGGENLSLVFKVLKRGQKLNLEKEDLKEIDLVDIGLRYDLTLPLSRYYANNQSMIRLPFKCIQIDKVFRAERPQKGRYREFYQCDIDIIGDDSINAEIELIHTTASTLLNLGLDDFVIRVNDRRILTDVILFAGFKMEDVNSVCIIFDKLDKIGINGVREELISKDYSKEIVDSFIDIIENNNLNSVEDLLKITENSLVVEELFNVIEAIKVVSNNRYQIVYDKSLVRGMGYYTGIVFEIASNKFSSSIGGGGRYNEMIGKFMNQSVPAVGFSIGFERLVEILMESGVRVPTDSKKVALLYEQNDSIIEVLKIAEDYRMNKYQVSLFYKAKKLGKQINNLKDEGFDYLFVFGRDQELKLI